MTLKFFCIFRFPHIRDSGSSQSEYLWNPCNAWVVDGSTPKENKCTSDTAVSAKDCS